LKLQAERILGVNAVSSLVAGEVSINGQPHVESIIVPWQGEVLSWNVARFEDLAASDFERIAALKPELVIFGSGSRIRFPSPPLLRPLIERRIGLETMDSGAACRTYNVLVAEGRSAVLALLMTATEPRATT
jgi:uncharacterized protein